MIWGGYDMHLLFYLVLLLIIQSNLSEQFTFSNHKNEFQERLKK